MCVLPSEEAALLIQECFSVEISFISFIKIFWVMENFTYIERFFFSSFEAFFPWKNVKKTKLHIFYVLFFCCWGIGVLKPFETYATILISHDVAIKQDIKLKTHLKMYT